MRGFRRHGWGRAGKHRGSGMRGGYGNAGLLKHKWTHTIKFNRDTIGKKGFICPTSREKFTIINLKQLDEIGSHIGLKDDQKIFIDLSKLGFNKLLSQGKVINKLKIKTSSSSQNAIDKIKQAGGEVIVG